LSEKESPSSFFRREEIRGLFVLGLLAVIASVRIQNDEIMVIVGENAYNVVIFLDVMIVMWSFYAFFMVLGLSEDIIGKKASSSFRETSATYLYISFVFLAFLSILLVYSAYPTRTPWALGFLPVLIAYFVVKRLRKVRKPLRKTLKISVRHFATRIKSNLYQLFLSAFLVCFLMVMFGKFEEYVIPSFIIGSLMLISFLIARERIKKS